MGQRILHQERQADDDLFQLSGKPFARRPLVPSDDDVDFVESLQDAVYEKLDQAVEERNKSMPSIMDECMEALRIELTPGTPEEKAERVEAVQMKIKSYSYGVRSPGRKTEPKAEWIEKEFQKDNTLTGAAAREMLEKMRSDTRAKILGEKDSTIPSAKELGSIIRSQSVEKIVLVKKKDTCVQKKFLSLAQLPEHDTTDENISER